MNQLAIIIPYYKIDFFEQTLDSLAKQTCKNFKVYIGDDASLYDPSSVIQKYIKKIDISYHKFTENIGGKTLVKQWKRCIELSKCEPWIMILGDDDKLDENCIEEFYKHLPNIKKNNYSVIKFATIEIDKEGNQISQKYTHPRVERSIAAYVKKIKGNSRSSLIEYIFSREKYQKYGFKDFPLAFGSDNLAWIEFTECGNIYTINEAVVYFRLSLSSISGNTQLGNTQKIYAMYLTKKYIIQKYFKHFTREEKLHVLYRAYKELILVDNKNYKERLWIVFNLLKYLPLKVALRVMN